MANLANPTFSIIFPVKNEGKNVVSTLDSLYTSKTKEKFEVIIIDDASNDGCCDFLKNYRPMQSIKLVKTKGLGAASARNLGAQHAQGDYLIFCDAHLNFQDWWIDQLASPLLSNRTDVICPAISAMNHEESIGYGQTLNRRLKVKWNPNPKRLSETAIIPGGCFMISKKIFNDVGGFDHGFVRWGHEDVELSIKLWLFGYRCHVLPTVTISHLFRKKQPYEVEPEHVHYNFLRMAYSHFSVPRIVSCKKLIKNVDIKKLERNVLKEGAQQQRKLYLQKRKYNDDWFFHKFSIPF